MSFWILKILCSRDHVPFNFSSGTFISSLDDFLISIQDNSVILNENTNEFEEFLLFIEDIKKEIQNRDKLFFEYYE